ncbi:serine protease inhibitor [Jatrophihabitans telluris]|uniref:Serine protease inhibitor n=1 Tax=Jatrophihabitans telluris TaxID=2038343 RepID=A0ABY4QYU0_9ACTN|nr:I78 family peptidase inhibitor [Jatrophihabitans telluris]UQX88357.1 serine protease inhibitor [Jatrophihabitans telluris]
MTTPTALSALNLQDLVGLPADEAAARVERAEGIVRRIPRGGLMTMDYRANRVTIVVEDGVVTEVVGIG